jgi:probable HAF family extracellular repeat protein
VHYKVGAESRLRFLYSNSTYTALDDPSAGQFGTNAAAVNDAGQIVGGYYDSSGNPHGFLTGPAISAATDNNATDLSANQVVTITVALTEPVTVDTASRNASAPAQ